MYQMIGLTMLDNHVIRCKYQTDFLVFKYYREFYILEKNHRKMEYTSTIAYILSTKSPRELKLVPNDYYDNAP